MMDGDGVDRRRGERRVGSTPAPVAHVRVLVVEDNRLMRDGLARLLAAFPDVEVVASAENANVASAALRDARPQVVLLDGALADGESHTFLSNLKSTSPDAKAIVIDFVPAQQDVQRFTERGANGFIMKDATAEDIVNAIRSVASGTDLPPPPSPPRSADSGGGPGSASGTPGIASVRLTKREQEIRELISAGLGNREIGQRLEIATNTVKSHVHNMLGKLAALTPPEGGQDNRSRRGSSSRSYRFSR
jgi:DNA-binding NarL/FixJ family response regulator